MPKQKTKLQLTWIGKENRPKLEPRILIENPEKSYHATERHSEDDIFYNQLIFGDNLLALKALEQEFTGKIKCIYIDPPYNTGSAFEHYDDGVEHSIWLSLMRDRMVILKQLLAFDGSIWISMDDNECHYFKVMMDEVFGRSNFIATIVWQKIYTVKNSARHFSDMHDYILVYAKDSEKWTRFLVPRTQKQDAAYSNPDDDPRGPWKATPLHARNPYSNGLYEIKSPSGRIIKPPRWTYWRFKKSRLDELIHTDQIWWGHDGTSIPSQKRFLKNVRAGVVPATLWTYDEAGHNAEAKNEMRALLADGAEIFMTPKPERLVKRILEVATQPGDLILDSFGGSGTTGAVAHKMGRRWIMVELGEHCHTHIIPRMKKVIDGENPGGITKAVNWKGGGGFRYYRIGPSLIIEDEWGNPVINLGFNAGMLAEAMCKLEGFEYAPSEDVYWIHGKSTETDFLYVTTQFMSKEMLTRLSDEVGPERSLLICCSAFRCDPGQFPNLTIKKIPKAVLKKCEWGHDDYSLEVINLPEAPPEPEEPEEDRPAKSRRKFGKGNPAQETLFDMGGDQ